MVTSRVVVDEGQCKDQADLTMPTSRTSAYDVETRSLRQYKSTVKACPKSSMLDFSSSSFKVVKDQFEGACQLGQCRRGVGSGESSPTCVIQNSVMRSNSSSPTMSTISKASNEPYIFFPGEGSFGGTGCTGASCSEQDDRSFSGVSPRSEPWKIGDLRDPNMLDSNTPRRLILKGPNPPSLENDSLGIRENGEAASHDTSWGETTTPPFKSIQCAVAEKTATEFKRRKKHSTIPALQSANIMSGSSGIFSFNAAYISETEDFDQALDDSKKEASHVHRCYVQRSNTAIQLRPVPSKWDDAEKWLPGSDQICNARAKARSGPMLVRMLATQGGMSMTWKESPCGLRDDRCSILGQRFTEGDRESVRDRVSVQHLTAGAGADGEILSFPPDVKEKFKMMVKQYSRHGLHLPGGRSSSERDGSVLNVGTQVDIPLSETSPSTRAVGTSMTPIASVEPSRPGTPIRTIIAPENMSVNVQGTSSVYSENGEGAKSRKGIAESQRVMTDKEFQERTRLEIVALGNRLGKTKITAWAAREEIFSPSAVISTKDSSESKDGPSDGFATREATWERAKDLKFNFSSQQEAEIQASEVHVKAKEVAKMRGVEIKTERIQSYAREKLKNKLSDARHHAETLRLAAKKRRCKAAAKPANKAEVDKTSSKILNLMFLSSFCK